MGIIKSDKTVSKTIINGEETFDVTLSLESSPNISSDPKDVVLILDTSGSMRGDPLDALKVGAKHFIDVLDKSTDGIKDDIIGNRSRIGLVEFNSTARIVKSMSTAVLDMQTEIDKLITTGLTNHAEGLSMGRQVLNVGGGNGKIMVLFTDGESTPGQEGFDIADTAKAEGTEIYCIGLDGAKPIDRTALERWASTPTQDHILISPTPADIEQTFDTLAAMISEPKATGINFVDTISPCFNVVSVGTPSVGTASRVDAHNVKWNMDSLGAKEKETATLSFTVKHVGDCSGDVPVNVGHQYTDNEGNTINLPDPIVTIVKTTIDVKEDDPEPHAVTAEGCKDYITYNAGDIRLDNIGRILSVSTTIKSVCPNKEVALAVIVHEVDAEGMEHARGIKTLVIPPHTNTNCVDINVECIKFVLPEALDMQGDPNSLCNDRVFHVRFIANYIDTDYVNCNR